MFPPHPPLRRTKLAQALAAVGLPTPREERLGDLHAAFASGKATVTT